MPAANPYLRPSGAESAFEALGRNAETVGGGIRDFFSARAKNRQEQAAQEELARQRMEILASIKRGAGAVGAKTTPTLDALAEIKMGGVRDEGVLAPTPEMARTWQ